jgi:hypothetical protein
MLPCPPAALSRPAAFMITEDEAGQGVPDLP